MLLKLKRFFGNFRFKKRRAEYEKYIRNLLDKLQQRTYKVDSYKDALDEAIRTHDEVVKKLEVVTKKREKASKLISVLVKTTKELNARRDEFLSRLKSKMPDDVLSQSFPKYKYWLAESFIVDKYTPYDGVEDKAVFIDEDSAKRGFSPILDKIEEFDKNEKEKSKIEQEGNE